MMREFPIQTGLAILATGAVLFGIRLVPSNASTRVSTRHAKARATTEASIAAPAAVAPALSIKPGAPPLYDDSGGALDGFYAALASTERREGVTRIVHYGDSPTTADLITGDVRYMLQAKFGDAGHGFLLVTKPWAWYQHDGVKLSGSGWKPTAASHFIAQDGMFGLGGVSFIGGTGAATRIHFERGAYTNFELWFLRQPGGGTVQMTAEDVPMGVVNTAGDAKEPGFAAFDAVAPATSVELRVTSGKVRAFGLSATRPGPGIVYDGLGLNGASITVMTRMFNQQHWGAELQHRNPALVIVNYGANEADFPDFVEKQYEKELRAAIARLRAALPQTALLLMSPMDRGHKTGPGQIETMATIPQIVGIQRRVARETGCGFFDTFQAMGGEGTMARWYTQQPRLVSADFIHPYPAGGKIIAQVFVREMIAGLERYKLRK
jgi:lysophospholipase L1-like esterase